MNNQSLDMEGKMKNIQNANANPYNELDQSTASQRNHQNMMEARGVNDENKWKKHYIIIMAPIIALVILIVIIAVAVGGKSKCKVNQIRNDAGDCVCAPYFRQVTDPQDPKNLMCKNDECKINEINESTGTCQKCPAGMFADENYRGCVAIECEDTHSFIDPARTCEPCMAYTVATEDKMSCELKKCAQDEKVTEKGECVKCDPYTHGSWDKDTEKGQACISDPCNGLQKLLTDGTCEDCPASTQASADGKKCDPFITCEFNQKAEEGLCKDICSEPNSIYTGSEGQDECFTLKDASSIETLNGFNGVQATNSMKYILSKSPNFNDFVEDPKNDKSLWPKLSFQNTDYGGSYLTNFQYKYMVKPGQFQPILTPILQMIQDQVGANSKLAHVKKLRELADRQGFFDIWILYQSENNILSGLAENTGVNCCLSSNQAWLNEFNGIARALTYLQDETTPTKEYLIGIYEGKLTKSNPDGFGRFIRGDILKTFIGFFKYDQEIDENTMLFSFKTQKGYGKLFSNEILVHGLKYSGYYDDGQFWESDEPKTVGEFRKFTEVKEK